MLCPDHPPYHWHWPELRSTRGLCLPLVPGSAETSPYTATEKPSQRLYYTIKVLHLSVGNRCLATESLTRKYLPDKDGSSHRVGQLDGAS